MSLTVVVKEKYGQKDELCNMYITQNVTLHKNCHSSEESTSITGGFIYGDDDGQQPKR